MNSPTPLRCTELESLPGSEYALIGAVQEWAYANCVPLNAMLELTLDCNLRCVHCYNCDRGVPGAGCAGAGTRAGQACPPKPVLPDMGRRRETRPSSRSRGRGDSPESPGDVRCLSPETRNGCTRAGQACPPKPVAPDAGRRREARPSGAAAELTTDEILGVMTRLREAGCLFLGLTGGEPLLHPRFFDILDHARRLNMAVQLLSNGTLIADEAAARLAGYANLLGVSVSLYGAAAETHDAITRVPGSFEKTWSAAERLRARGVAVRLKFLVMRRNVREAEAMIAAADARGYAYNVDATLTGRHSGTDDSLGERIPPEALEALYRGPLRKLAPDGRRAATEETFPCNCARGNCAVSSRGDVYPCISVPWPAGNIRETPFAEIWRDAPVFRRIRGLRLADYPRCGPCPIQSWCMRPRGAAFLASGEYTGIDPWVCAAAEAARRAAQGSNRDVTSSPL